MCGRQVETASDTLFHVVSVFYTQTHTQTLNDLRGEGVDVLAEKKKKKKESWQPKQISRTRRRQTAGGICFIASHGKDMLLFFLSECVFGVCAGLVGRKKKAYHS